MLNRKITSESFDHSLEEFEDSLPNPALSSNFTEKMDHSRTNQVDLETGEVYRSPAVENATPPKSKPSLHRSSAPSSPKKNSSRTSEPQSGLSKGWYPSPGKHYFVILVISLCLLTGGMNYYLMNTKYLQFSTEEGLRADQLKTLEQQVLELHTQVAKSEPSIEVFEELDNLSQDLGQLENALQQHLQTAKNPALKVAIKPATPIDLFKKYQYLGMFGTMDHPQALLQTPDAVKHFQPGDELMSFWTLRFIHPTHLIFTHSNGTTHTLKRKHP